MSCSPIFGPVATACSKLKKETQEWGAPQKGGVVGAGINLQPLEN